MIEIAWTLECFSQKTKDVLVEKACGEHLGNGSRTLTETQGAGES